MKFKLPVLLCLFIFSQNIPAQNIPKDWFEKDPKTDSVAGISLEKAYRLLKGRISKPVIVAVIDNGIDINHEDLKIKYGPIQKKYPITELMTTITDI